MAAFEHVAVALCGGHLAPGHECDAACVEQRGDVPVIGEGLGGGVHTGPCAVPQSGLIAHVPAFGLLLVEARRAVDLDAEVEASAYGGGYGIERVGHDAGGCERGGQQGEERLAQRGEVSVGEGSLELACAELHSGVHAVVHPCLLQHVGACGSRVDAQVIVQTAECLARETQYGIGDGEA